jgi:hypothetical protein
MKKKNNEFFISDLIKTGFKLKFDYEYDSMKDGDNEKYNELAKEFECFCQEENVEIWPLSYIEFLLLDSKQNFEMIVLKHLCGKNTEIKIIRDNNDKATN